MKSLPSGWTESLIPVLCDVLDSMRVPLNADERNRRIACCEKDSLIPYYGATGQVGWIDSHLFDENLVLLGEDGVSFLDPGRPKAYRVTGKTWVNNHAHVLRAHEQVMDWRLLTAQLNSINYTGYVTGSTRLKLTQGAMNRLSILVPPRAEQKRIADKLDTVLNRVDAVNARLARVAPLLKRFRQSVLRAAFDGSLSADDCESWSLCRLGDLLADGPKNGLYKHRSVYGSGTPILRIDAFYDGRVVDWASLKRLQLDAEEINTYQLSNGDIVTNRVNSIEYIGKCALIEGITNDCVFESNMMRMRFREQVADSRFIRDWLCSEEAKSQIRSKAKHAVNQASINQTDIRSLQLRLPTIAKQAEIVSRVETLFAFADRLEARLKAAQTATERLTPSLLAKAFRGELVPQDPNDEPAAELLQRLAASAPATTKRRGRPTKAA